MPFGPPDPPPGRPFGLLEDAVVALDPTLVMAMKNKQKSPGPAGPLVGQVPIFQQGPTPPPDFIGPLMPGGAQGTPGQRFGQQMEISVGQGEPGSYVSRTYEPGNTEFFGMARGPQGGIEQGRIPGVPLVPTRPAQSFAPTDPSIAAANLMDNLPGLYPPTPLGRRMATEAAMSPVLRFFEEKMADKREGLEREKLDIQRKAMKTDPLKLLEIRANLVQMARQGVPESVINSIADKLDKLEAGDSDLPPCPRLPFSDAAEDPYQLALRDINLQQAVNRILATGIPQGKEGEVTLPNVATGYRNIGDYLLDANNRQL